jgi:putative spermidine/putrescine transport system substrate-binding protein
VDQIDDLVLELQRRRIGRRQFVTRALGVGLSVPAAGALLAACGGDDGEGGSGNGAPLTAVMWGGAWLDGAKEITAPWSKSTGSRVTWSVHEGGATAIIPKIAARWPTPAYDLVAMYSPVFQTAMREGWLETITAEAVPALADIPEAFVPMSESGEAVGVPFSQAGGAWGYRTDLVESELESMSDLLREDLNGQISFPEPVGFTGLQLVSLAMDRGGSETNIDPGFAFAEEIARAGNFGRIFTGSEEGINSITTGETAVAFLDLGAWARIGKDFPVTVLNRTPGFHSFLYVEGFGILKGPRSETAIDLASEFISVKNNSRYNEVLGQGPVNPKSEIPAGLSEFVYTDPAELEEFAVFPDYEVMSKSVEEWLDRWEKDIVPLIS